MLKKTHRPRPRVQRIRSRGPGRQLGQVPRAQRRWRRRGQNIPVEFSAEQGVVWKTPIPGNGNSSPVVWDKHIFLQSASADGKERTLFCFDAPTGKVLWKRSFPGVHVKIRGDSSLASATPAVDADAVYIPIWDGSVVHMKAFNFQGDLLWSKSLHTWVSQHGTGRRRSSWETSSSSPMTWTSRTRRTTPSQDLRR